MNPNLLNTCEVMNKVFFTNGLWHRKHKRNVRFNQFKLRVVLLSILIDTSIINTWVMDERVNHFCAGLKVTAAQRLALAAVGGRVDSPSKQETLKATKMPKKRAAYPPSAARCVGWLHD
jgi:hypothetical protein